MKKFARKISQFVFVVLNKGFLILFIFIFASCIFLNRSGTNFSIKFMLLAFFLGLLLFGLLLYGGENFVKRNLKIKKFLKTKVKTTLIFCFFFLFILQIIVILPTYTSIGWDVGLILDTATNSKFQPAFTPYFSYFPNNTLLVFSIHYFYKFFRVFFQSNIELFYRVLCVINIIFVDFGLFFGFIIGRKLFNLKIAYRYLFIVIFLFGLSPWLMVSYSDTLSIPFTTGIFLLLLKIYENDKIINKVLIGALLGVVLFIGYSLKPSTLIVLIAVIIIGTIINLKDYKKILIYASIIMISLMVFLGLKNLWKMFLYDYQTEMEISEDIAFPWTYWVATGLHSPYGACSPDDQWDTIYRGTSDRMYELHKELIKERLTEKGALGYSKFLINKTQWITSEGFFYWGKEGVSAIGSERDAEDFNLFKELFYTNGKYKNAFNFYYQSIWIFVLFTIIVSGRSEIFSLKNNSSIALSLIRCILIGLIFYILFLEGRSRYLILYIPYFALTSSVGFDYIVKRIKQ